jgi:hypothetical protein
LDTARYGVKDLGVAFERTACLLRRPAVCNLKAETPYVVPPDRERLRSRMRSTDVPPRRHNVAFGSAGAALDCALPTRRPPR